MANITINTRPNPDIWFELSISHKPLDNIGINFKCETATELDIDWGDGVIEYNVPAKDTDQFGNENSRTYIHTYVNNATKFRIRTNVGIEDIVEINAPSLNITNSLSQFSYLPYLRVLVNFSPNMQATTSQIPPLLEYLYLRCPVLGPLSAFPTSLYHIQILNSLSNITGSLNDLWSGLKHFEINKTYLEGTINSLPNSIKVFNLSSNTTNTITGNISNLPLGITYFRMLGRNSIGGNINALPNSIDTFIVSGNNTIGGDISLTPNFLKDIQISGENIISGSINTINPALETIIISGNNTISGNLNPNLNNINVLNITGANTISGNIENCSIPNIIIGGNNTITGNIGGFPDNSFKYIYLLGNNTVKYNTSKNFSNILNFILILGTSSNTFTPLQVDQLLIDLAAGGNKVSVKIYGEAAVRTANSNVAVASITNRGGEVLLQP